MYGLVIRPHGGSFITLGKADIWHSLRRQEQTRVKHACAKPPDALQNNVKGSGMRMRKCCVPTAAVLSALLVVCAVCSRTASAVSPMNLARDIVSSSGVKGGLCVHIGCTDGLLTAELSQGGKFLVHGLVLDKGSLAGARQAVQASNLNGTVSLECCPLRPLPYTEDLVNLLVVDDLNAAVKAGLSIKEVIRVLCPGGVAMLADERGMLKDILGKPGIEGVEIIRTSGIWAKIRKPRPPVIDDWTHWRHGPDGNMVSKDTAVGIPARLKWIAGPTWARTHVWTDPMYKIGDTRTMVSAGGRIFYVQDTAPRGVAGPIRLELIARDAFNGLPLWRKPIETKRPPVSEEMFRQHRYKYYWYGRRALATDGDRVYAVLTQGGPLAAIDAATGRTVTTYEKVDSPEEIVLHEGRLLLTVYDEKRTWWSMMNGFGTIACVDRESGERLWQLDGILGKYVLAVDDRVFFDANTDIMCVELASGKELWRVKKPEGAGVPCFYRDGRLFLKGKRDNLFAVSAGDGSLLWSYQYEDFSGYSDTDVFFVGGLVWVQAKGDPWAMIGLDPATGKETRRVDFPKEYPATRGHHRCHPNKATERYFLLDTAGIDFVDPQAGKVYDLRTFRANCYFGLLPANGLLYLPPNVCQCGHYYRGLVALAPARKNAPEREEKSENDRRFERGPAPAAVSRQTRATGQDEWPSYRHDPERSGSITSEVPPDLKLLWEKKASGNITAPTVAEGRVFVASKDTHQVRAFDAGTGEPRWSYTAGGPIDTPPTIYAGLALFGCRNGWVYSLRAKDGKLVWRFRAAPREQRIVAFEQLESSWPVHGSVLVHKGTAFFAAGRFSELDGGIYVYAVDPATGKILWQQKTSAYLDQVLKGAVEMGYPPVCINDVLIADGNFVSIRTTGFDVKTGAIARPQYSLWPRSGMLDGDSWTGRMRWRRPGIRAELLIFDRESTYGVLTPASGDRDIAPGKSEYKLFAKGARNWSHQVPLRVNAMVLAGDTLFAAGIPDVVDEKDYWAPFDGRKGGELRAFAAADGRELSSLTLESAPVYDGMAAAYGRLYLSTRDGTIRCFGK